jgi:hypothetical protein
VEARTARGPAVPHEVTRLNDVVFSGYPCSVRRCGYCPSEVK